jgi:hypothetical protein
MGHERRLMESLESPGKGKWGLNGGVFFDELSSNILHNKLANICPLLLPKLLAKSWVWGELRYSGEAQVGGFAELANGTGRRI